MKIEERISRPFRVKAFKWEGGNQADAVEIATKSMVVGSFVWGSLESWEEPSLIVLARNRYIHVKVGEWVACDLFGNVDVYSDEVFNERFEEIED